MNILSLSSRQLTCVLLGPTSGVDVVEFHAPARIHLSTMAFPSFGSNGRRRRVLFPSGDPFLTCRRVLMNDIWLCQSCLLESKAVSWGHFYVVIPVDLCSFARLLEVVLCRLHVCHTSIYILCRGLFRDRVRLLSGHKVDAGNFRPCPVAWQRRSAGWGWRWSSHRIQIGQLELLYLSAPSYSFRSFLLLSHGNFDSVMTELEYYAALNCSAVENVHSRDASALSYDFPFNRPECCSSRIRHNVTIDLYSVVVCVCYCLCVESLMRED